MTNFEKFVEVFGMPPETDCPFECSEVFDRCPYKETDRSCRIHEFWDGEYKEEKK